MLHQSLCFLSSIEVWFYLICTMYIHNIISYPLDELSLLSTAQVIKTHIIAHLECYYQLTSSKSHPQLISPKGHPQFTSLKGHPQLTLSHWEIIFSRSHRTLINYQNVTDLRIQVPSRRSKSTTRADLPGKVVAILPSPIITILEKGVADLSNRAPMKSRDWPAIH